MLINSKTTRLSLALLILSSVVTSPMALAQTEKASSEAAGQAPTASAVLTVSVANPKQQKWPVRIEATGLLQAWQEIIVSAEVSGQRLVSLNADIGNNVIKGDVLAELSSETIKLEIRQRQASLKMARANLELSKAGAVRANKLKSSGTVSQEQLTEALVAETKAEAEVASAEAALELAQLYLAQTKITAIDDGVISSRAAVLGNVVAAGGEIFRLIRQGKIEWHAEVPLRSTLSIRVGTKAVLPTPIGDITGAVRLISPTTSEKNGRLIVIVELDKPDNAPPPTTGILVSGYFTSGETMALTIPATAVTVRDGFSYVYVLNADGKVSRKRVSTGRRIDGLVEIVEGLASQDQVVQSGGAFLNDGAVVRLVEGSTSAGEAK